jgi:hypothetical protein
VGVATRCPASGLLVACLVWALDAPTPLIRRLGRMHEVARYAAYCWAYIPVAVLVIQVPRLYDSETD